MVRKLHNNYTELMGTYEQLEASNEELIASDEELRRYNDDFNKSRQKLQISEERFRLATEGSNVDIWDLDIGTNIFTFYKSLNSTGPYGKNEKLDDFNNTVHPDDREYTKKQFEDNINKITPFLKCEFREKTKNGDYRWVLCKGKTSCDSNGKPIRMFGSNTDITDRKKSEERANYMAHYDSLTELPNRTLLNEKLTSVLNEADVNGKQAALLYLDLDNFKTVNDSLGHNYGDELLRDISRKLETCVRKIDTISRLGGDEFAILLPTIENTDDIIKIIDRIMIIFKYPFILSGKEFYITSSIGISIYPNDGQDTESLMRNSDTAMYSSKNSGKNKYKFFNNAMNDKILQTIELENNLRHALKRNEFVMHYQPKIDLVTDTISGFEALIRWESPSKGLIPPMDFIPLAEETGLIVPIGDWVLKTACQQIKKLQDLGYTSLNMSINLSARQFKHNNLVDSINNIISETGIGPESVELEITETMVMENLDNTVKTLKKIKESGIKISLDDFGIGYSSLNYLRKLPIDILKIDKDFVLDILQDKKQAEIAKTIILLAHSMDLKVIAEGVGNVDILNLLKNYGCDMAQGYLFSKPIKSEYIEEMLKKETKQK